MPDARPIHRDKSVLPSGGRAFKKQPVLLSTILGALALLSLLLTVWQFFGAIRFPLHQRVTDQSFVPPITLLKPLKGSDFETAGCLRSWLTQDYPGPV